jgi:hypothetical protein
MPISPKATRRVSVKGLLTAAANWHQTKISVKTAAVKRPDDLISLPAIRWN